MKIKNVSVRGYRTLKDEISFGLDRVMTLVGPNNSGKTNTLRAIQLFFTGYDNALNYEFEKDMCKGESSLRTNIQITLSDVNKIDDLELFESIAKIREVLEINSGNDSEITLYLTFSPNSNPVYRVFPNAKRPKGSDGVAYSRLERKLFDYILGKVSVHYIPSEKSVRDLYNGLVVPYLFKRMYDELAPNVKMLESSLDVASNEINAFLKNCGLGAFEASFELPVDPEKFFGIVDFNLKDINKTSVFEKGMGIQSAVLLSSLCWIARQEKEDGKLSLWLLEEPESFLHPELASQCLKLLKALGQDAQVIVTTHSLGFVPQDPDEVVGLHLDDGWTKSSQFKTCHEATKQIRSSLGVKFSDYYNFSEFNILVEGQTDRKYIQFVIDQVRGDGDLSQSYPIMISNGMGIHDYGGIKGLEGFLRATYEFVREERAIISLFDGDDAGDKARRDLQRFFGQKNIPFNPNEDFVIVRDRFSVEGLVPDEWIKDIHQNHAGWFEIYGEDASGRILPFRVKDGSKEQYLNYFKERVKSSSFIDWFFLLEANL